MRTNHHRGKSILDFEVYQDEHFLIINKPPGLSTLGDRASEMNVLTMAKEEFPMIKVGHRLDKETSGLLVLAKNDSAYKHFSSELENREVHKLYHAIVPGRLELEEKEIDLAIHTSSNRSRIEPYAGKPSVTLVQTLQIFRKHTLLACMPVTGRMHQIRVHLAHLGHSIIGDSLYHGEELYLSAIKKNYNPSTKHEERPLINRLALHAFGISFQDQSGKTIKAEANYPKDFAVAIKQLVKYN